MQRLGKEVRLATQCAMVILIIGFIFTAIASQSDYWFKRFNYVMFTPAPIAAFFLYRGCTRWTDLFIPLLGKIHFKALAFAILYPLITIVLCTFLAQEFGLAVVNWNLLKEKITLPSWNHLIWAFFFIVGEEYAWRGYLFPAFAKKLGAAKATILVGSVWAVWHGPLVYLLASTLETTETPINLVIIQMVAVVIFSFPFSYSYLISKSVFIPALFHYIWNWLNPIFLGNIYRNKPGIAQGDIVWINGEGILGATIGSIFVIWFLRKYPFSTRQYDLQQTMP